MLGYTLLYASISRTNTDVISSSSDSALDGISLVLVVLSRRGYIKSQEPAVANGGRMVRLFPLVRVVCPSPR